MTIALTVAVVALAVVNATGAVALWGRVAWCHQVLVPWMKAVNDKLGPPR